MSILRQEQSTAVIGYDDCTPPPKVSMIYLDHNSTSPLLPEAAAAMAAADTEQYANPASQHAEGRRANRALQTARDEIAELPGACVTSRHGDRLIFTSGGTEANNLALAGLGLTNLEDARPIIISAIEHPSIAAAADAQARRGVPIHKLSVTSSGIVRLEHLLELLSLRPRLVSVMLANNETGVIQPIEEIVRLCAAANVPVHTDAAQAVGKLAVNSHALGVSAMTIAPHKFGGPRGIGGLILSGGAVLRPLLYGGAQQLGLRPGTESVTLALGFLAALKAWHEHRAEWSARMETLRDRFESSIRAAFPTAIVNGSEVPRLPNTSNIAFVGYDRQALLMAFDLAGLCCSTGSACSSGSSEPSPTLLAMQLPREVVNSSLRFSIGPKTTMEEIDIAVQIIQRVALTSH
jgi:cysteine desulfurase